MTCCSAITFSTRSRRARARSRLPAWVVVRRSAHQRHQQRDLGEIELRERLAEIELARETKAVHRALAILAEDRSR